jgi:integrase
LPLTEAFWQTLAGPPWFLPKGFAMKKVWYREQNGWWYVSLKQQGRWQQIKLIQTPNTCDGRELAEKLAIKVLADLPEDTPSCPSWVTVAHVIDGFLRHSSREHEPRTYAWYKGFLDSFKQMWGNLRVALLRKQHITKWLREKAYNSTSQNKSIGAIKRAFNWAVEEEHIAKNPIAHVRKPQALVRDRTLTLAERNFVLDVIKDDAFRDYVTGLTLTGARPGEVARVRAADVNLDTGIWVLTAHKTAKRTGRPRFIYLCPEAVELTKRLIAACPDDGPIFRNQRGKPWTGNAVRIRFRRLRRKYPQLKGVIAYCYRASFATDALEQGVPDATVATLLGHTNTNTLHKFYARLSHKVDHLKDAARKATRDSSKGHDAPPDTAA